MIKNLVYSLTGCLVFLAFLWGCQTGIEPSPQPGILRVTLVADSTDTCIVIRSDTSRFSKWDSFILDIGQGRLYRGENYSDLYLEPTIERIAATSCDIIKRKWLNDTPITYLDTAGITTSNSRWIKYVIFETYVPPGDYDRLQFSLTGTEMDIFIPKVYQNPVKLPDGVPPIVYFYDNFKINEGRVTEVSIEIKPYKSLSRYRDVLIFDRQIQVVDKIEY